MNKILGASIFVAIVGAGGYLIYKHMKEKSQEITVEEIMRERENRVDGVVHVDMEIVEVTDFKEEETNKMKKGTDVNSQLAIGQYVNMKLADFDKDSKEREILKRLFAKEFDPVYSGDRSLRETIMAVREDFFGDGSKWVCQATWADVILHFCERIDYNLNEGVPKWASYIVHHLGLTDSTTEEDLDDILDSLNEHSFINDDTGNFGLFGLDDEGAAYVELLKERAIDHNTTLDMEYNGFMSMIMDEEEDEDE